jgi:tetraacyldisaccharide 4'-kinase
LFPARWLYQGVTGMRNWMFDHSLLKAGRVESRVISIGNLTMGGTGKTPVTLALLGHLKKKGYSCGVISRGYKRSSRGNFSVDVSPRAALDFGDEPALIKSLNPDTPVWVGAHRVQAAKALLTDQAVDFIVCDDAFQHRRLHRDLNILLMDATEAQKDYRVLPVGRARESLTPALRRADFVIVTKANLIERQELTGMMEWIKSKTDKPLIVGEYHFKEFRSPTGKTLKELKDSVYLVSGIAKPQTLEKTLGDRVRILKHRIFEDHHRYSHLELEEILDEASQLQARWVLTTAKDGTKLSAFPGLRERLWIIELEVRFKGEVDALYEAIDRLARSGR